MRKVLTAFVLILIPLFSFQSYAQEIKAYAGADWARYGPEPGPIPIPEISLISGPNRGFVVGLGFDVSVFSLLGLELDLQYFEKGTSLTYYQLGAPDATASYGISVLSLPACLRLKPCPRLSPYALAGVEISYVLKHEAFIKILETGESFKYDYLEETRRWDIGIVMGGGVEAPVKAGWILFSEARYYLGLVNLAKPPDGGGILDSIDGYPILRTRALVLQAGLKFRF